MFVCLIGFFVLLLFFGCGDLWFWVFGGFFREVGMGVCLLMPIFEIEINSQNVNELVLISFRSKFSEMLVVRGQCLDLVIYSTILFLFQLFSITWLFWKYNNRAVSVLLFVFVLNNKCYLSFARNFWWACILFMKKKPFIFSEHTAERNLSFHIQMSDIAYLVPSPQNFWATTISLHSQASVL